MVGNYIECSVMKEREMIMFKTKSFCTIALAMLMASTVFAEDPLSDVFAINGLGDPTSMFLVNEPVASTYTVNDTLSPASGGAASIVGYGLTPAYSGTLLAEAEISRFGGDSICGLMHQLDVVNLNAYYLSIDYFTGQLDLNRLANGALDTNIDFVAITGFDPDEAYFMEFSYSDNGDMLGELFDESDTLVATVSGNDTTYTTNLHLGILTTTNVGNGGLDSTRGSFAEYDVIPEPMTLTLLGVGAAGLIARRKRR